MDKEQGEARKQVSREEVKLLAISVGVTEAARKLGLSEQRVRQWSSRGKWFSKEPKPMPPSYAVTTVTSPSEALLATLEDDSRTTKLSLSKGLRTAAKVMEDMPGLAIYNSADKAKHLIGGASQLHGWEQKEQGNVDLHLNILAQQSSINFNGLNPEHAGS